ncbi:Vps62-related protein [Arthrobacter sp. H5]|uniref:Vps62-related protein n=1 Tax=Arthrobacter sp. H5 TaxID=1267973 RepID=UPI000485837C|nr:Vps62-related protein [Arthrobacter sp. H5]
MSTATTTTAASIQATETPAPGPAVYAAIQEAGYAERGAPFGSLLMKFAAAAELNNGWNSQRGQTQISFFQSRKIEDPENRFRPLGDFATINNADASRAPVMLVAPGAFDGDKPPLVHPKGFHWILKDKDSGNSVNMAYYSLDAPEGYRAMGIAVGFNDTDPDPENYWCVDSDLVHDVPEEKTFWNDKGSNWDENASLNVVDLTNAPSVEGKLTLAPTTFLSVFTGGGQGKCLVLEKLKLPVHRIPPAAPIYEENSVDTKTAPGLGYVEVLPCSIITDALSSSGPKDSPFYYLASEPYWNCFKGFDTGDHAKYTESVLVGTSLDKSEGFQNTTSLTVGAETGVEAGGFSAKLSVSYTNEMQVSSETTEGHKTEVSTAVDIDLPRHRHIYLWQARAYITVYRTKGSPEDGPTILSRAPFGKDDLVFTKKPVEGV